MGSDGLFDDVKDLFKHVYKTYNKTENEVKEDIETIKKWLRTQHHLPEIMQDSHICNFLNMNKFSTEKTKQKIDMYYTIRSLIPDFYDDCNPKSPRMRAIFENVNIGIHPKLVQDQYRVYMCKMNEMNKMSPREIILTAYNIAEVRLDKDCIFYDIFVIDFRNVTFNDILKVTPSILMKSFTIHEKVYSLPVKGIYLINAPPYISKITTVLKTILKPKIFQRIHVCENDEILKEIFTVDDLPKDYGGNGPTLQEITSMVRTKFDEYQSRFDQLDKMRVNETLRPGKLINDDILGFHGNFKKLTVD